MSERPNSSIDVSKWQLTSPWLISIGGHLLLILIMLFGVSSSPEQKVIVIPRHINATVVDVNELPSEKRKIAAEQQRIEEAKAQAQKEREKRKAAEARRKAEEKERAAKEQQRQKKLAEEKALRIKQEKEKQQKIADEKRKEQERKDRELKEKQRQQQEEKARVEKEKAAQQAREKQLLESLQRAENERKAREEQEARARELARLEQQRLNAQRIADASEIEKFYGLIQDRVQQRWHRPPVVEKGMQVRVRLRLTPTGELVSADIVSSSGNAAYDHSVISAVKAVGTFPVPSGRLFEENFRQFTLFFNPKD